MKSKRLCAICEMGRDTSYLCPHCQRCVNELHADMVLHDQQVFERMIEEAEGVHCVN